MPFELYVALRYLFARRKQAFISVISLVSMLGVTVGVMALVIALALMTGLQQGVRDRMLGSSAHVYVFKAGGLPDYHAEVARLRQVPDVLGAAPALMGKALVSHGDQQAFITIKGIDPALEPHRHRDRRGDHRRPLRGSGRHRRGRPARHPPRPRAGRPARRLGRRHGARC